MKTLASLLVILVGLMSQAYAKDGQHTGNGGDAVICTASRSNDLKGTYALDFLMTLRSDSSDLPRVASLDESLNRILMGLARLPSLETSFKFFIESRSNHDDWTQRMVWQDGALPLINLADEVVTRTLPPNCSNPLRQVAIRESRPTITVYFYDSALIKELEATDIIQASMALVHEWLWDFFPHDKGRDIAHVNRFLHSERFLELESHRLRAQLKNMGISSDLDLKTQEEIQKRGEICERSSAVLNLIYDGLLDQEAHFNQAVDKGRKNEARLMADRIQTTAQNVLHYDKTIRLMFPYSSSVNNTEIFRSLFGQDSDFMTQEARTIGHCSTKDTGGRNLLWPNEVWGRVQRKYETAFKK